MALLPQTTEKVAVSAVSSVRSAESGRPLSDTAADLTLEVLMRQALDVPGAATALLEAFAAHSRALRLVQEADARGAATLPADVRHRVADAAERTPSWLASAGAGVRA